MPTATIDDAAYNLIADFMNDITDAIDWNTVPEELKSKYNDAQQALAAIGDAISGSSSSSSSMGMAAPS